ncbi:MAG: type IV secretion system protein [Rickettsiales bacterium]|nr:type IV secretion system protein [Rickettsiales bacterium]
MAQKNEQLKLRSWYSNKYQMVLLQKKILSFFCILAMATVVIAVIFVKKFTESKSFEPYVIEFEEKTGLMNTVENLSESKLIADEAIKKFYINSFLEVSEGYNYVTFNTDRVKMAMFTTSAVYRQLYSKYSTRNENSIVNLLRDKANLTIKIKSIVFLTPVIASVRFVVYNSNAQVKSVPRERHLIANIQFKFTDMKMTQEQRFINPLGFQVTKYSVGDDMNI